MFPTINSIKKYYPPRLSVDEIGWVDFLKRWASAASELSRAITLREGMTGYTESYAKSLAAKHKVYVPEEFYRGGLEYPPKTEQDKRRCEENFLSAKAIVKASLEQDPEPYETYMIQNSYEYRALIGIDALLFPPATAIDIAQTEKRLGITLPPSYKDFLAVSNGFWAKSNCHLLPVQTIGWQRDMNKYYSADYVRNTKEEDFLKFCKSQDYYRYDPEGLSELDDDSLACNPHRLLNAIQLTALDSNEELEQMIGLIPYPMQSAITEAKLGEWEAYKYTAPRAVSFKLLMEHLYQRNIALKKKYLSEGYFELFN